MTYVRFTAQLPKAIMATIATTTASAQCRLASKAMTPRNAASPTTNSTTAMRAAMASLLTIRNYSTEVHHV